MKDTNIEYKEIKTANAIQEQYRVVVSKMANASLETVVTKVNKDFDAGLVTKSDVADYVFLNLAKLLSDSDIKSIRSVNFDEKKVLGTILKNETELPEELRKAVRDFYGLSEKEKKRNSKSDLDLSTAKPVDKLSAA